MPLRTAEDADHRVQTMLRMGGSDALRCLDEALLAVWNATSTGNWQCLFWAGAHAESVAAELHRRGFVVVNFGVQLSIAWGQIS